MLSMKTLAPKYRDVLYPPISMARTSCAPSGGEPMALARAVELHSPEISRVAKVQLEIAFLIQIVGHLRHCQRETSIGGC